MSDSERAYWKALDELRFRRWLALEHAAQSAARQAAVAETSQ